MTALTLSCFIVVSSCASSASAAPSVRLSEKGWYPLLGPEYLEKPVDEAQEITGIYNSKALTVLAWALADENAVVMAFFDSFGVSLGEVSFTRGGAVLTSQIFPPSLKAEYIIADFQLCFYRGGALSRALAKGGLVLKEARKLDADGNLVETRAVFDKRKPGGALPLIEIEKRQGRVRYVNHKRGYAFSIAPQ